VIVLFNAPLAAAFQPSKPMLMSGERITLDFFISFIGPGIQPSKTEWYLEFTSDDPTATSAKWARETAEEYTTGGVTHMPVVLRDFPDVGSFSAHFIRAHQFVRVQIRDASGFLPPNLFALVRSPFGILAQPPA
jgi:hypothetical protein